MTALCHRAAGNNERQNRYGIFDGISWRPGSRHFVRLFTPVPEEIGAGNPKEAERIRATVECIKQSGGSKDRDYGYKIAKCAEQPAEGPEETR
jgi:hypothetical protein